MSELLYYDLKQRASMAPSLPVQVARELGRRIVGGTIQPDSFIDDENALCEQFKVSRVVIRDAVKILVGKGLLEVRRGIGTRVLPRNRWMLLDDDVLAWHLSGQPDPRFLAQLTEMRMAVEPRAAWWAAERGTPEAKDAIQQALEEMKAQMNSVDQFVVADAKFHKAILHAAGNEFLAAFEGVIYSALLVSVRITNSTPEQNENSIPFHKQVCDAIAKGDGKKAHNLSEKLLMDAMDRLKSKYGVKFE